jgi:HD domain
MPTNPPALTTRFLAAVALAQEVHGGQRRSGTEIPYLAHLLVVTGLVFEDGGDEDEAIAAMLHDAVEDGGGRALLERIRAGFGARVAEIVAGCSDSIEADPTHSWIERKRRYLAHLPDVADDGILRVALADKVHNARSIVRDYREEGHALWDRFTQKTTGDQLWYYSGLLAFFERRRPGPLTEDLRHAVTELAWLVARDEAQCSSALRLWLDPDLHGHQAPDGWVQVRTAGQAIELLGTFSVKALSLEEVPAGELVVGWLIEQLEARARDRWPEEDIDVHGTAAEGAEIARLGASIERHSSLRRAGPRRWTTARTCHPGRPRRSDRAYISQD